MAQSDLPPGLAPSLMDRLLDPDSMGTRSQPGYTLDQILISVKDDLEELLNTRRAFMIPDKQYPETAKSVVTFGLPDLSFLSGTALGKQEEMGRLIEKAIGMHEPRLRNVRAKIVRSRGVELRVQFHIDGELRVENAPAVTFETVVELTTGHVSVREGDG